MFLSINVLARDDFEQGRLLVSYAGSIGTQLANYEREYGLWCKSVDEFGKKISKQFETESGLHPIGINWTCASGATPALTVVLGVNTAEISTNKPLLEKYLAGLETSGQIKSFSKEKHLDGQFVITLAKNSSFGPKWDELLLALEKFQKPYRKMLQALRKTIETESKITLTKDIDALSGTCLIIQFPGKDQDQMEKYFSSQVSKGIVVGHERDGIAYPQ